MSSRSRPVSVLITFAVFAATALAASCSGRYGVVLHADGAADLAVAASLEPQTARLVTNLADLAGKGSGASAPLLDAAGLSAFLRAASGVAAASLRNPDARSVAGTVRVTDLESFLATPTGTAGSALPPARFIRMERFASGGRLAVSLDRVSGAALLANLSPDLVDYVSALLAPVATGEQLGKAEYLELVESLYGRGVAAEIGAAIVRISVELPGEAVSVRGGVAAGRRVDFSLPLVDLLVLDKPIVLEAGWK